MSMGEGEGVRVDVREGGSRGVVYGFGMGAGELGVGSRDERCRGEEGGEEGQGRKENGGSIDEWRTRRSEMRYLLTYLNLSV